MKQMIKDEMEKTDQQMPGTSGQPQLSPGTQIRKTVASVTAEIKEKAKREKRLVIYNLEEQKTNIRAERVKLDKEKVIEIATNTLQLSASGTPL